MGELLGIPEWLAMTSFVLAGLAIWLAFGFVMHRRGMRRLAAKRPNPTRREFLEMMLESVENDTAEWLWAIGAWIGRGSLRTRTASAKRPFPTGRKIGKQRSGISAGGWIWERPLGSNHRPRGDGQWL
jgi:hypothetical protein